MSKISEETKQLLNKLWVIDGATLRRWGRFRIFEEIRSQLVHLPIENDAHLCFISHRWETKASPDPDNYQYAVLSMMIQDDAFYWYDYACVPQQPRTNEYKQYVNYILENLNEIVKASKMIILRKTGDDYFARGWCFHEWFTAQFIGGFGRQFLRLQEDQPDDFNLEIVQAKRQGDRLLCGKYSFLKELGFTKEEDRKIVFQLTKSAAVSCQKLVAKTCLEIITRAISDAKYDFPLGIAVTSDDIHQRFPQLVKFIKVWTLELQPVEPVTDRIAMFFHKEHWEALIKLSRPIAVNLLRLEYGTDLRTEETTPVNKELRKVYEFCQRMMPETRYAVTAFLCFYLMGYDIHESNDLPPSVIENLSAAECGLVSQQHLNAAQYKEAEAFAQVQLKKAIQDFDDEQTVKALSKLGRIYRSIGDFEEASKYYQRSLNLSEQICDTRAVAIALDQIGTLHRLKGDTQKAIELYQKSLDMHLSLNNDEDIGVEYGNLGCAYLQLEEIRNAEQFLTQAIMYSSKAEDTRNLSMWYVSLGALYEMKQDWLKAKQAYENSLKENRSVGNRNLESYLIKKLELLNLQLHN